MIGDGTKAQARKYGIDVPDVVEVHVGLSDGSCAKRGSCNLYLYISLVVLGAHIIITLLYLFGTQRICVRNVAQANYHATTFTELESREF